MKTMRNTNPPRRNIKKRRVQAAISVSRDLRTWVLPGPRTHQICSVSRMIKARRVKIAPFADPV